MTSKLADVMEAHGVTIESVHVPTYVKHIKDVRDLKLKWTVKVIRKAPLGWDFANPLLTAEYSTGIAHCPSYKPFLTMEVAEKIQYECAHGKTARMFGSILTSGKPILPNPADVMYSLLMDSTALNYRSFEDWADEFGYSSDSISAKKIYDACLDIGLRLRNGLGEETYNALVEACEGY